MKTPAEIAKTPNLLIIENDEFGGRGRLCYGAMKNWSVIWTRNKGGYDHVSVNGKGRTPSWEEMCKLKDMFFYDEEEAYQVFPKKSEYVNIAQHCLHIWRNTEER